LSDSASHFQSTSYPNIIVSIGQQNDRAVVSPNLRLIVCCCGAIVTIPRRPGQAGKAVDGAPSWLGIGIANWS
jgi:hypothetical protein